MTTLNGGYAINSADVKPIALSGLKPIHVSELPQELFDQILDAQESMLRTAHSIPPNTKDHPAYKPYATVEVEGKVVAEIDNHGFVTTSNGLGAKLNQLLPGSVNGKDGPILADARAAIIAQFTGGTVKPADTALTQGAFEALPKVEVTYDEAAIRSDPQYQKIQDLKKARVAFLAQLLGQEGAA